MKTGTFLFLLFVSLTALFFFGPFSPPAAAGKGSGQEIALMGQVKSVDLGAGILVVTEYTGRDVRIVAGPDIVHRIKHYSTEPGDDVTVKYVREGGQNVATFFRKIMGCGEP